MGIYGLGRRTKECGKNKYRRKTCETGGRRRKFGEDINGADRYGMMLLTKMYVVSSQAGAVRMLLLTETEVVPSNFL